MYSGWPKNLRFDLSLFGAPYLLRFSQMRIIYTLINISFPKREREREKAVVSLLHQVVNSRNVHKPTRVII